MTIHARLEDRCRREKQNKCDDLDDEASKNNILSSLAQTALGHHAGTPTLNEEGEDITGHENLGDPFNANGGQTLGLGTPDNPREDHVDSGCEEGGCDEDEDALDDVRHQSAGFVVSGGSSGVADKFN